MKKTISIILAAILMLSLFTGCSKSYSKGEMAAYDSDYSYNRKEEFYAEPAAPSYAAGWSEDAYVEEAEYIEAPAAASAESGYKPGAAVDTPAEPANPGEKIIYSANMYLETTDFDNAVAALEAMVNGYGGYIQSSSVNGTTKYNSDGTTRVVNRNAYYSIAVPCQYFQSALNQTGNIGNCISKNQNAENITSRYTDTEARVESLQVQEERILAMMKETTDIESLIILEQRLSEITYEKESYQRTLKNYDRQVAYSTISVSLQEVEIYTPTVPVVRTFGEKLSDAFSDGWKGFRNFLEDFTLWFAEALPSLILLAVVIVVIVILCKRGAKRRKAKKAAARQTPVQPTYQPQPPKEP